VPMSNTDAP